jgi:phenylpyruvate tautomerase PptA (4-oxalocrotonate tautomerase family)
MPITIQLTRGLLTEHGERTIFPRVASALLEVHGLADNAFMAPNVIGHLELLPEGTTYVHGRPQSLAVIEVKVPSITFGTREIQSDFVERVTEIVDELRAGDHPRSRTFVNVTYAADGAWGIGGRAYTNADLASAVAGSADASRTSG